MIFKIPTVCPDGFTWWDQLGCVSVVTAAASKAAAQQSCQAKNPAATLMMPKTANSAWQLQQLVSSLSLTDGNFFLGMSNTGTRDRFD
jgi:hypothetical protein